MFFAGYVEGKSRSGQIVPHLQIPFRDKRKLTPRPYFFIKSGKTLRIKKHPDFRGVVKPCVFSGQFAGPGINLFYFQNRSRMPGVFLRVPAFHIFVQFSFCVIFNPSLDLESLAIAGHK